jgi:SM-20-related protein
VSHLRKQFPAEIQNDRLSQFVIFSDFLRPKELDALLRYVQRHEEEFEKSRVGQYSHKRAIVNASFRRSRVLFDLGKHRELITLRLLRCLPLAIERLGTTRFRVSRVVAQVTASNNGDFFKKHTDSSLHEGRVMTFIYYFYREPKAFAGGELRLYHTQVKNRQIIAMKTFDTVVPQQNHVLFFPSFLLHEVLPVRCPTGLFADSRFTVNGWISK